MRCNRLAPPHLKRPTLLRPSAAARRADHPEKRTPPRRMSDIALVKHADVIRVALP